MVMKHATGTNADTPQWAEWKTPHNCRHECEKQIYKEDREVQHRAEDPAAG